MIVLHTKLSHRLYNNYEYYLFLYENELALEAAFFVPGLSVFKYVAPEVEQRRRYLEDQIKSKIHTVKPKEIIFMVGHKQADVGPRKIFCIAREKIGWIGVTNDVVLYQANKE